ncbi:hypothetical protein J6590_103180 [Homalodisca vitripennis]|nr:hypothetical protein J6590_103180 [Homalodisca vitripennis]
MNEMWRNEADVGDMVFSSKPPATVAVHLVHQIAMERISVRRFVVLVIKTQKEPQRCHKEDHLCSKTAAQPLDPRDPAVVSVVGITTKMLPGRSGQKSMPLTSLNSAGLGILSRSPRLKSRLTLGLGERGCERRSRSERDAKGRVLSDKRNQILANVVVNL